jgi:hypothetical protein
MKTTNKFFEGHSRVISFMLLVGLFASCGLAQAQNSAEPSWNQIRPEIRANLQTLQREAQVKGHTFTVGYSPAMEHPISKLCGLVEPKNWRRFAQFEKMELYTTVLPTSFDWGLVPGGKTQVRNQGGCGSCWAFGTVAPLEVLISAYCGKTVDLSEQYLVSCNVNGWGCGGGWFAHDYHQWKVPATKGETDAGAVLESSFPYTASNVACNGPHSHPYKINSYTYIAGYGVPLVADIKQAIYNHGPVSVAVCVGSAFQAYRTGIFNANETCSGTVNHAVALVGWNDDQGTDNGYWILKNSWGTGWGEGGYMRIRYGVSKVGYAANYIDFSDCGDPSGLECGQASTLKLGTLYQGTTVGSQSKVSSYGCGGRTESGPETVYKVVTTSAGDLSATLSNLGDKNLDVFILKGCDPTSCAAYGETTANYGNAPAGTYYIVVDGNDNTGGAFNLQVDLAEPLPDLTGSWTQLSSYSSGRTVYGTLKVSNAGNLNAGAFKVTYYLSNDRTTASKLLLTQTVSAGLKAGVDMYLYPRFTSTTSLSKKYIIAKIDYDNRIVEKNEANNMPVGQVP